MAFAVVAAASEASGVTVKRRLIVKNSGGSSGSMSASARSDNTREHDGVKLSAKRAETNRARKTVKQERTHH